MQNRNLELAHAELLDRMLHNNAEYADAHAAVCVEFNLGVEEGEQLTKLYDKGDDNA